MVGGGNRLKTGTWPIPGTESIKIQIVPSLPFEPSQDPTQQLFSLASEKVLEKTGKSFLDNQSFKVAHSDICQRLLQMLQSSQWSSLHPGITLSE